MFVLASPRMNFCVSLVSLSMLLISANSPFGWPGMISGFVTSIWVGLLSWNGLNLVFVAICLCFSAVSSLLAVSSILLDSGVPMVLLAWSVMVVWFYRSSFYCFGRSSVFVSTLSLVFLFVCFLIVWLSALLPGPFVPADSAISLVVSQPVVFAL